MKSKSGRTATDPRPGFNPRRLAALMRDAIERCRLDLTGLVVLTEAATGAYVVTPVLAAMAGAKKVFAITKDTHYGTVQQVSDQTRYLARLAGVERQIEIVNEKTKEIVAQADIVTNSGHVRPIDADTVSWMKSTAVIPLMYEAWEIRPGDIDLNACRGRGISVAGTNERHPDIDIFSFLGIMAIKLLTDAGITVYKSRILLVCDNAFGSYLERDLTRYGAILATVARVEDATKSENYDVILVALNPTSKILLGAEAKAVIHEHWQNAVIAQFVGDIDRDAYERAGISVWPREAPSSGHMGILPSDVGPEPVVRLQTGGLKVGEILLSSAANVNPRFADLVQTI